MKTRRKSPTLTTEERAILALRAQGAALWRTRKGTNLSERHVQGSWGDYSYCALDTPEGLTAEQYLKALNAARQRSYPSFKLEDGKVIEENYYSNGD